MRILILSIAAIGLSGCGDRPASDTTSDPAAALEEPAASAGQQYLETSLLPPPLLPAKLDDLSVDCPLGETAGGAGYRSAAEVDYGRPGWEQRVAADWDFFAAPASDGWLTVIDFRQKPGGLAYRYLANDRTHDRLYEPWSSSKIMAFTAAVAALRPHGIGADSSVGGFVLADLITGINSYEDFGTASGESNAIATFFLNLAGRDFATSLFHDEWLALGNADVRFRGAYGPTAFDPGTNEFVSRDGETRYTPTVYPAGADDPGYLAYRCENCGTDGNKAMTALAQTEWLKRLASHTREPLTRHPELELVDVETVFFGRHHTDPRPVGGMLQGISRFLPEAIAATLAPDSDLSAGAVLDDLTDGRWRIYQKVGWGPSETRGTSELVVLAHVCLPQVGGTGREFTLVGRAAVPGADPNEHGVGDAGIKLDDVLRDALPRLFE